MLDSAEAPAGTTSLIAVQTGIVAGLFTCLAYPVLVFVPLPKLATTTLAACFGPALGVASFGLRKLLDLKAPLLSSALAWLLNALAGALFSAMALVQMAVHYSAGGEKVSGQVRAIWLGLDVAWDAYIGLGTICFALAMLRHPCFGRVFALSGLAIAVALLVLNFYTFPTPPASAGLVDLGPAVGLWYLIVTVQMWRSLRWARLRASET
ncbi:MAG: hypothetical protein ABSH40_14065 [Bryobacteraceae bacterium]|jgi:hypothetical protein